MFGVFHFQDLRFKNKMRFEMLWASLLIFFKFWGLVTFPISPEIMNIRTSRTESEIDKLIVQDEAE